MKVFIVLKTVIGNWVEDFQNTTLVAAVFSTAEKADEYIDKAPKEEPAGFMDSPVYDEESGEQIGLEPESMYRTTVYYTRVEKEIV